jgi:hypothetical protein
MTTLAQRLRRLPLLLLLASSLACTAATADDLPPGDGDHGDSSAPADPGGGPIPATVLCARLTEIFCAAEQACCTEPTRRHASAEACVAERGPDCETSLTPIFTDSRTGYSSARARERIDDLLAMTAACDPAAAAWTVTRAGLLGVMEGTVALDGNCSPAYSGDLAPGMVCLAPQSCLLEQVVMTFEGTCGAARGLGGDCFTDLECQDGLYCEPPNNWFGGGGSCTARLANGGSCGDNDTACLSWSCEAGLCAVATANSTYCLVE